MNKSLWASDTREGGEVGTLQHDVIRICGQQRGVMGYTMSGVFDASSYKHGYILGNMHAYAVAPMSAAAAVAVQSGAGRHWNVEIKIRDRVENGGVQHVPGAARRH